MTVRIRNAGRQVLPWIAAAALAVFIPRIFPSEFALSVFNQIGIALVFALSYNLLLGEGGMVSFGHSVLYGLGGFCAMHAVAAAAQPGWPLPVFLAPLVGAAGGALFGILFGYVATQRAGLTFAMITLGIGELVSAAAIMLRFFFGGEQGVSGDRTDGPHLFWVDLGPTVHVYYFIATWSLLAASGMYFYTRTPLGRMTNAVRDNAQRVSFIGFDPKMVRFITFVVAAAFAGLAGGLAAVNYEIMNATTISLQVSGLVLLMAYIGGQNHFYGPIIGAAIITFFQTVLSDYTDAWLLYIGLLFVAVVIWAPDGIAGAIKSYVNGWRQASWHWFIRTHLILPIPAAFLVAGIVGAVELGYRLSDPSRGTGFRIPGVILSATSPASWGLVLGAAAGGGILLWVISRFWLIEGRPSLQSRRFSGLLGFGMKQGPYR